ncbi:MAG: (Fe-S)-binding protein [Gammaproteobacteria bacterium]|nr:(Fe-S)-binding protein [Gammaproteobacteria bacterium]
MSAILRTPLSDHSRLLALGKQADLARQIAEDAGRCVACGLCLPHCPTYQIKLNEADSPRGRIALAQALATGELSFNRKLNDHFEQCLGCRACEAMCPSLVRFSRLLCNTRSLIETRHRKISLYSWLEKLIRDHLLSQRANLEKLNWLVWLYRRSGMRYLLKVTGLQHALGLTRLDSFLPEKQTAGRFHHYYPAVAKSHGSVSLFMGCVNSTLDQNTLTASIRVLTRLGYEVHIPENQTCCGAIHQHAGDLDGAARRQSTNLDAFTGHDAVISTATGCTAMLSEYGGNSELPDAQDFSERVFDINRFLAQSERLKGVTLKPAAARIVVHEPCSLRNVLKQQKYVYELLRHIPQSEIVTLQSKQCCGGAGTYPLRQKAMADELIEITLSELRTLAPAIVVTTNIGCALQLRTTLASTELDITVLHPVELLDQLWETDGNQ